mmetsp:Transcript_130724/g.419238  ORF Transcript_130724/g.419238 Transcript_130724/m.419238 type:complete len:239 (+) Transcript_130724:4293-5009(+)
MASRMSAPGKRATSRTSIGGFTSTWMAGRSFHRGPADHCRPMKNFLTSAAPSAPRERLVRRRNSMSQEKETSVAPALPLPGSSVMRHARRSPSLTGALKVEDEVSLFRASASSSSMLLRSSLSVGLSSPFGLEGCVTLMLASTKMLTRFRSNWSHATPQRMVKLTITTRIERKVKMVLGSQPKEAKPKEITSWHFAGTVALNTSTKAATVNSMPGINRSDAGGSAPQEAVPHLKVVQV